MLENVPTGHAEQSAELRAPALKGSALDTNKPRDEV